MLQLPKDIKIIYASTSGNVEAVCEYVGQILEGHHFDVELIRAETCDASDIIKSQLFVFATSTWEHGEINPYFKPVLFDFAHLDLKHKFAGFIGLGDTRYEPVLFCKGAETARDTFAVAGGQEILEMLKINHSPFPKLESVVKPWVHRFVSELVNHDQLELI